MIHKQDLDALGLARRVPVKCRRTPNATFDRSFAIFTCNQRDMRCPFHGPTYVLDNDGYHFECRKRAEGH